MAKYLLSILIATKNRQIYCHSAVKSILEIANQNIEVIVQDNSDDQTLKDMLKEFDDDKRLVYQYTPPPFSSIDNFNAALHLANGEYVCLIGDDDGINPEIIEATQWAKDNNVEALVGNIKANYRWSNTGAPDTFFTKMTGATLTIQGFDGKVELVDIKNSLNKLMENGCTNYLDFPFPKLYHGVVKMSVLDKIKAETGEYLKGLSPDIYSAITLACNVNKLVFIDYPLTIPGVCGQSTSITEGQLKKHSKRIEDAPHFRDRGDYNWSKEVPRIYCVQCIWADSGFAALREMGRHDLIEKFNKYSLYANILIADPSLKDLLQETVDEQIKNDKFDSLQFKLARLSNTAKSIFTRGTRRLKIMLKITDYVILNELTDMSLASQGLSNYLKKHQLSFTKKITDIEGTLK